MIRRPPRSTRVRSSAASDVYKRQEIDLGWVGETEVINPEILMIMAGKGYIPVIAPIAVDSACHSLNLNADTVAGDIAAALMARKLISLTDVKGIPVSYTH